MTLSTIKKSGEPINNSLAKAINSVMYNPISDEKLRQKFDKHKTPEHLEAPRTKKCSYDIWAEIISFKTRSRDMKLQKLKRCTLLE